MSMQLFVTGASRGIGKAVARRLAPDADHITLLARDRARLDSASEEILAAGAGEVTTVATDLGDIAKCVRDVSEWARTRDTLDVAVLDAGIFTEGSLAEQPIAQFEEQFRVNVTANLALVQVLLPLLRKSSRPRIILIGSTAAYEDYPLVPSYGVAKWALRSYASNLRLELRAEKIGVSFISPGGTQTDMWEGEDVAPDRLLAPDDVAVLVHASLSLSNQAVVEELIVRPILGDIHE